MRYTLEFIPEVKWEPDTDKWRLFPESKYNLEWYREFDEPSPLNEVQRCTIDGEIQYLVEIESGSIVEAFRMGYELIMERVSSEGGKK